MTISRKTYFILAITALLISCAVIFFIQHRSAPQNHAGEVFLKAVPVQTAYGWGYNILANGKVYIHQDYIPAAKGKQGFTSREEALRVANRVIDRIGTNQLPVITLKDLDDLGIQRNEK